MCLILSRFGYSVVSMMRRVNLLSNVRRDIASFIRCDLCHQGLHLISCKKDSCAIASLVIFL